MPQPDHPRYWFPAKAFGWGWGPPSTWEGWGVLGVYLVLLIPLCRWFPVNERPGWFSVALSLLIGSFLAICWWKGEPPKWRWG